MRLLPWESYKMRGDLHTIKDEWEKVKMRETHAQCGRFGLAGFICIVISSAISIAHGLI